MYQRRIAPASTAVRWSVYHLLVQLLGAVGPSALFARYEDVVAAPAEQIRRIVGHLGEEIDERDLSFLRDGEAELATTHTVAGSLMRLKQGPLALRLDDEWETALAARHRRVVTLLSWPLLRLYGYSAAGRPSARSG
jgi:hypothetical protein